MDLTNSDETDCPTIGFEEELRLPEALCGIGSRIAFDEPARRRLDRAADRLQAEGWALSDCIDLLLTYKGSSVVLDLEGELYRSTSDVRRCAGQEVWVLDPFDVGEAPSSDQVSLNPLSCVGTSVEEAAMIADALVLPEEGREHWNESARGLLTAVVLHATRWDSRPSLSTVRWLMSQSHSDLLDLLDFEADERTLGALIARQYRHRPYFESIYSTACRHTQFLDDYNLSVTLGDFWPVLDVTRLQRRPTTLYVCVPALHLHRCVRLLRLVFTAILSHGLGRDPVQPSLFALPSASLCERLRLIPKEVMATRGLGRRPWYLVEDLSGDSPERAEHLGRERTLADVLATPSDRRERLRRELTRGLWDDEEDTMLMVANE